MFLASVVLLATLFTTGLQAQRAILSGVAEDETGARVPGAALALVNSDQIAVAHARTDDAGAFRFSPVAAGAYSLIASRTPSLAARIAVRLEQGASQVTLRMNVQPASTSVTVTAEVGQVSDTSDVAQRTNVISSRRILERMKTSGADLFAEEPGVEVQRTAPAMAGVAVRGLLGRNVALYRDGVRYTTSAQRGGVSTFWNLNDPDNLDSAEVLRGPNSAQYGSDSMGGTVHLLSVATPLTASNGWHGEIAPQYFSPSHTVGTSLLVSHGGPRFGILANLPVRRTSTLRTGSGIDSHAAVTRFLGLRSEILGSRLPDTAWTQYGGMVRMQYALTSASHIVVHSERSQIDGAKRYDQLLGGDGNLIADLRNLMLDFGYVRYTTFASHLFDQVSGTVSFNRQREERVNQGGNGNPAAAITHQYERTTVWGMAAHAVKRIRRNDVVLGVDGYREMERAPAFSFNPVSGSVAMSRPRVPNGARYLLYGAYLQHEWEPFANGRLRLGGAIRIGGASYRSRAAFSPPVNGRPLWPDDRLAANAVSGRFGAVLRLSDPVRLHFTWSRGFRAPNMTDLGTAGIQGNGFFETSFSDLVGRQATIGDRADERALSTGRAVSQVRAETSDNFDAGLVIRGSRMRAEFSAFRIALRNTIASQTLILPQGSAGLAVGDQIVTRQLASGAVFVPAATNPVLVRANIGEADFFGWEHQSELRIRPRLSAALNATWIYARDRGTGLPPDIEGGVPPLSGTVRLRWSASTRLDAELYSTLAGRQNRLSSLALADRRTGASRSAGAIANFFNNGARVRGLVANGRLLATGETLAQVQSRVLGTASAVPMFTSIPGYALHGIRMFWKVTERSSAFVDASNLLDKSHRSVLAGIDGAGRGITLGYRYRF